MCNGKHIRFESVTRQTEPAREPLLQIVSNAAQTRLSAMQVLRLDIPNKVLSDFGALGQEASQVLEKNSVRTSGNQHNRLSRGKMPSGQGRSADRPPMPDYGCFKDTPCCDDSQRDEARFYEIDVFKLLFLLFKYRAFSQNDRLEVFSYCREFLKRNARKNPVFDKGPRAGTHSTWPRKHSRSIGWWCESGRFGTIAPAEDGQELVGHTAIRLLVIEILGGQPLLTFSTIDSKC